MKNLVVFCLFTLCLQAKTVTGFASATVTVNSDRTYEVRIPSPSNSDLTVRLLGQLSGEMGEISETEGSDRLGSFRELSFPYVEHEVAKQGSIRVYIDCRCVLFNMTYLTAGPAVPFPNFEIQSGEELYRLTYNGAFAGYNFDNYGNEGPWILFGDSQKALVISPASKFLNSGVWSEGGRFAAGIRSKDQLRANFSFSTLVVFGQGITETISDWGRQLQKLYPSEPSSREDILSDYLSYGTQNGGRYYYYDPDTDPDKHLFPSQDGLSSIERILLSARDEIGKFGVRLRSVQLDSWFYPKGPERGWKWKHSGYGMFEYKGHEELFPRGLDFFQKLLGLPLTLHARWIDQSSFYRQQYQMSGGTSIDQRFWNTVLDYVRSSGATVFEQDWLDEKAASEQNLDHPEMHLSFMAKAARDRNRDVMYCMATPKHMLYSVTQGNVQVIRASQDGFTSGRFSEFLYASTLVSSLGKSAFTDVLKSSDTASLLLATLSGGPVMLGDGVYEFDRANIKKAFRTDGAIVRAGTALKPTNRSILAEAMAKKENRGAPTMVATSQTNHDYKATYVLAYRRDASQIGEEVLFIPSELGYQDKVFVYDYFSQSGQEMNANEEVKKEIPFGSLGYYVVVPVTESGLSFLGDYGQFVGLGHKRVTEVLNQGHLTATVQFTEGEEFRVLFGSSPYRPKVWAQQGYVHAEFYNDATRQFAVWVKPEEGQAIVSLSQ